MAKVSGTMPVETVNTLDEWYARKFESRCPQNVRGKILTTLVSAPEGVEGLPAVIGGVFCDHTKYFTDSYAVLHGLCLQFDAPDEDFTTALRGSFAPVTSALMRMGAFIGRLRPQEGIVRKTPLTDAEIDAIFEEAFGGHEGFTGLCTTVANAAVEYFGLLERKEKDPAGYYAFQKDRFREYRTLLPGVNAELFRTIQ